MFDGSAVASARPRAPPSPEADVSRLVGTSAPKSRRACPGTRETPKEEQFSPTSCPTTGSLCRQKEKRKLEEETAETEGTTIGEYRKRKGRILDQEYWHAGRGSDTALLQFLKL